MTQNIDIFNQVWDKIQNEWKKLEPKKILNIKTSTQGHYYFTRQLVSFHWASLHSRANLSDAQFKVKRKERNNNKS